MSSFCDLVLRIKFCLHLIQKSDRDCGYLFKYLPALLEAGILFGWFGQNFDLFLQFYTIFFDKLLFKKFCCSAYVFPSA